MKFVCTLYVYFGKLDFYNAVRMERGEGFLPSMVVVRGRKCEWTIPHAIKKRVYGNKEVA